MSRSSGVRSCGSISLRVLMRALTWSYWGHCTRATARMHLRVSLWVLCQVGDVLDRVIRHPLRLVEGFHVRVRRSNPIEPGDRQRQLAVTPGAGLLRPTPRTDADHVVTTARAQLEKKTTGSAEENTHGSVAMSGQRSVSPWPALAGIAEK